MMERMMDDWRKRAIIGLILGAIQGAIGGAIIVPIRAVMDVGFRAAELAVSISDYRWVVIVLAIANGIVGAIGYAFLPASKDK